MKIAVIAVGKIKEKYFTDAIEEYSKRLGAFCELSVAEIRPEPLPQRPSPSEISAALESEGNGILQKLPKGAAVFPLCVEGKGLSSEDFAKAVERCGDVGQNICFIIGGSYGLSDSVKRLGESISFSKMTFPHRLFRLMLLEQLYRAFTIISGKTYHK